MKIKNHFSFQFLFSIGILISLQSCFSFKPVSLKEIKNVSLLNNDISSGQVQVLLRIANPNNYAIKIKKYNIHAFLNNTDMGQVGADDKIVLRKRSEADYTLNLKSDASRIMSALPALMLSGSGEAALRGSVQVKALLFSKTFPVDLKKRVSANDFR